MDVPRTPHGYALGYVDLHRLLWKIEKSLEFSATKLIDELTQLSKIQLPSLANTRAVLICEETFDCRILYMHVRMHCA